MNKVNILPKHILERQEQAHEFSKKWRDFFTLLVSMRWKDDKYEVTFTDLSLKEADALAAYLKRIRMSEVILVGEKDE